MLQLLSVTFNEHLQVPTVANGLKICFEKSFIKDSKESYALLGGTPSFQEIKLSFFLCNTRDCNRLVKSSEV